MQAAEGDLLPHHAVHTACNTVAVTANPETAADAFAFHTLKCANLQPAATWSPTLLGGPS